ncbi:MAG: hypothetical protein JNL60_05120 [Bacteroidia bacterium]|nr:hypothetical protein [Bacteroidia bacterium]
MKKLTTLLLAGCVSSAFAQDLTSKKGEQMLPEEKDWAIGIDATPFLDYMGNFFGKTTTNNAPTFNFLNYNQTITGKYFVDAQTAYRASLRIGLGSNTQRNMVADRYFVAPQVANPTDPNVTTGYPSAAPLKENSWKQSRTNIGLAVGMEKRRGKTRLQGYYGAELGINFSSSKDKYTYGNALSTDTAGANFPVYVENADNMGNNLTFFTQNQIPGIITSPNSTNVNARVTERKNGAIFSFGVRAFVGVEYFILPKISLGGEFGWGLALSTGGKSKTTYESMGQAGSANAPSEVVDKTTIEGAKQGAFQLDTDNSNSIFGPSASLRLNFHF